MANQHHQNGGRNVAVPDENRPSWRPQDQSAAQGRHRSNDDDHDYGSWRDRNHRDPDRVAADRDPQRWEGSRGSELGYGEDREGSRSTESYGQGQSGYSAGRYGEDRSQHRHMQNRNEMVSSPATSEQRNYDVGTDDRFTGRGGSAHWSDRNDRGAQGGGGRGFESERNPGRGVGAQGYGQSWQGQGAQGYGQGTQGYGQSNQDVYDQRQRGYDQRQSGYAGEDRGYNASRGYDQHMGYQGGPSQGSQHMGYQGGAGQGSQHMGYQGGSSSRGGDWSPSQQGGSPGQAGRFGAEQQGQQGPRGAGPHRGKGPQGYQRSDERIRELVSEALADDEHIDASQIHVTVKDGEVTLAGTVDHRRTRREAEDCVARVSGVRDVLVQLKVRDDAGADRGGKTAGQVDPASQTPSTASQAGQTPSTASHTARDQHAASGTAGKLETETSAPGGMSASQAAQDKKPRA